jgi:hypothetical protein
MGAQVKWKKVYTVNEYYDGVVFGVADYCGVPHVYDRKWDAATDEYGLNFQLAKIDADLLALILEDWEIWLRWQLAYSNGLAKVDTHPALPEERMRHQEIEAKIGERFNDLKGGPIEKAGNFRYTNGIWEVCWQARLLI